MLPAKPKLRKVLRRDGKEVIAGEVHIKQSLNFPSRTGVRFAKQLNIVIRDDDESERRPSDERVMEAVVGAEEGDTE